MNLDKIFDLLHCDIDVLEGLNNCNHNVQEYEEILSHFVANSAFDVLEYTIYHEEFLNSKRIARLLLSCAKKLGMTYLSDLLHDLLGCIQSKKWDVAQDIIEEVLSHISIVRATLKQYESYLMIQS